MALQRSEFFLQLNKIEFLQKPLKGALSLSSLFDGTVDPSLTGYKINM
jgi:hypothetical protein